MSEWNEFTAQLSFNGTDRKGRKPSIAKGASKLIKPFAWRRDDTDYGRLYVIVLDPVTREIICQNFANFNTGGYFFIQKTTLIKKVHVPAEGRTIPFTILFRDAAGMTEPPLLPEHLIQLPTLPIHEKLTPTELYLMQALNPHALVKPGIAKDHRDRIPEHEKQVSSKVEVVGLWLIPTRDLAEKVEDFIKDHYFDAVLEGKKEWMDPDKIGNLARMCGIIEDRVERQGRGERVHNKFAQKLRNQ